MTFFDLDTTDKQASLGDEHTSEIFIFTSQPCSVVALRLSMKNCTDELCSVSSETELPRRCGGLNFRRTPWSTLFHHQLSSVGIVGVTALSATCLSINRFSGKVSFALGSPAVPLCRVLRVHPVLALVEEGGSHPNFWD